MKLTSLKMHFPLLVFIGICCFLGAKSDKGSSEVVDPAEKNKPEVKAAKAIAEWTVLTFIQADNNLAPFAEYNVRDMEVAFRSNKPTSLVNMLVQWDQPRSPKTWRYRITPSGRIETNSLSVEMGINPGQEIIDSMQWAVKNFPAKHYALVLWNHGSGIQDLRNINFEQIDQKLLAIYMQNAFTKWIEIPGLNAAEDGEANNDENRGILYDDSQGTCLTNPELARALSHIKNRILGKNLDLIGMDACLMAMIEVAYQIKDSADVLVGSQQTEPGSGWAYGGVLNPLLANPAKTAAQFAADIVYAYRDHYRGGYNSQDYTQSAIRLDLVNDLTKNISLLIEAVNECKKYDDRLMRDSIKAARSKSVEFAVSDYIDMYSFYSAFLNVVSKSKPKSEKIIGGLIANQKAGMNPNMSPELKKAVDVLKVILIDGLDKINSSVIINAVGPQLSGAHGLSIYFPKRGTFHSSYSHTFFAQQTKWMKFVADNKKVI